MSAAPTNTFGGLVPGEGPAEARQTQGDDFDAFVAPVRRDVGAALSAWLSARAEEARNRGPDVAAVLESLGQLALRGGKRLRSAVLVAAYEACWGEGGIQAVTSACIALELFQLYLLTHDDWMDGDAVRRGGPSVPAMMVARFGVGAQADAASVLAGDLAAGWARQAVLEVDLPAANVVAAARELARAEQDVVEGQILDMTGAPTDLAEVEALHTLKTGSYTVRAPVMMGARLAGAREEQIAALEAYAAPLGVAFQLRDDVLGAFGDPDTMGKPAGNDLRAGKRTAVVVEAMRDPETRAMLGAIFESKAADEADLRRVLERVRACGALDRVERLIELRTREARSALAGAPFDPVASRRLHQAAVALTSRRS